MKTVKRVIATCLLICVAAGLGISQTLAGGAVKLRLNGEDAGTSADPTTLADLIKRIRTDRENEGILRPGTNEVEMTVLLGGDKTVPAETIAGLSGVLIAAGARSVLVPVKTTARVRPNPLLLYVHAGTGATPVVNAGIGFGFIGELFENRFSDWSPVAISANANGTYSIGGKQLAAAAFKTELAARVKALPKGQKVVFLQADNYGSIEEIASMAAAAGAVKLYVVTKNAKHTEDGISFSLSPAFAKKVDEEEMESSDSLRIVFERAESWKFEITVINELMEPERAQAEIAAEFETRKKNYTDASVFMDNIDGSAGVMTIEKDEGYSAYWIGSRKKGSKSQLVMIRFSCYGSYDQGCNERSAFTQSEFLQIKNSIRW